MSGSGQLNAALTLTRESQNALSSAHSLCAPQFAQVFCRPSNKAVLASFYSIGPKKKRSLRNTTAVVLASSGMSRLISGR